MKHALIGLLLATAPVSAPALAAPGLTGDWGGARTSLADSGVALRGDVTGFTTGQLAGTGDKVWDAFGRYDAFVDLDFGKMGLVKGLGFHVHGEGRFGDGQSNFGFQLWPGITGAALPLGGESFAASSLYVTQALGKRTILMLGKINAVDLLASDPVFGGWGTQRFQNIAFVAPPSGVVPPTIMGGVLVHKGTPISLTVMVFDPEDRTRDYFRATSSKPASTSRSAAPGRARRPAAPPRSASPPPSPPSAAPTSAISWPRPASRRTTCKAATTSPCRSPTASPKADRSRARASTSR